MSVFDKAMKEEAVQTIIPPMTQSVQTITSCRFQPSAEIPRRHGNVACPVEFHVSRLVVVAHTHNTQFVCFTSLGFERAAHTISLVSLVRLRLADELVYVLCA